MADADYTPDPDLQKGPPTELEVYRIVGKLARDKILSKAADTFVNSVRAVGASPRVTKLAAGVLLDAAIDRWAQREGLDL